MKTGLLATSIASTLLALKGKNIHAADQNNMGNLNNIHGNLADALVGNQKNNTQTSTPNPKIPNTSNPNMTDNCIAAQTNLEKTCDQTITIEDWIECGSAYLNTGAQCPGAYAEDCLENWEGILYTCSNSKMFPLIGQHCIDQSHSIAEACDNHSPLSQDRHNNTLNNTQTGFISFAGAAAVSAVALGITYCAYKLRKSYLTRATAATNRQREAQAIELAKTSINDTAKKWLDRAKDMKTGEAFSDNKKSELLTQLSNISNDSKILLSKLMSQIDQPYEIMDSADIEAAHPDSTSETNIRVRFLEVYVEDTKLRAIADNAIPEIDMINGKTNLTAQQKQDQISALLERILFLVKVKEQTIPESTDTVDLEQRCPITMCTILPEEDDESSKIDQPIHISTVNSPPIVCDLLDFLMFYVKTGENPTNHQIFPPEEIKMISADSIASAINNIQVEDLETAD